MFWQAAPPLCFWFLLPKVSMTVLPPQRGGLSVFEPNYRSRGDYGIPRNFRRVAPPALLARKAKKLLPNRLR